MNKNKFLKEIYHNGETHAVMKKYKIIFYYNDGSTYERELTTLQDVQAVECGILRGLYAIALDDPENFKKNYVVGYKLLNDKGELVDSHIYRKVKRVK